MGERKNINQAEIRDAEIHHHDCRPDRNGLMVALVYPDTYQVGMSSLGFLTVYRYFIEAGYKPERFFNNLRNSKQIPISVETGTPLGRFQTIAFHFSYELDYINAVKMLIDSGIQTSRIKREKSEGHFLIAGGIAPTANPLPLSKFFDAIFIGELDNGSLSTLEDETLNSNDGWFVPNEFEQSRDSYKVRQNRDKDWIDSSSYSPIITPHSVFSMTNLIEITRGCPVKCRFCLAGNIRKEISERPLDLIVEDAFRHKSNSKKVGLIGAIPSLHSSILPLLETLINSCLKPSLSALSVRSLTPELLDLLSKAGMKTLTLGIESFDDTVQKRVGKVIQMDKLLNSIEQSMKSGMSEIKIYLMLGLPHAEKNEEVLLIERVGEINEFIQKVKPGARIKISLNPFIPKIATPYEEQSFIGEKVFRKKVRLIRSVLAKKGIIVKSESHRGTFIQHLLSCGDEVLEDIMVRMALGESGNQIRKSLPDDLDGYLKETASKVSKHIDRY